jgi:Lrp/AsnC family leucine-responsive transcriptional regulator
MKGEIVSWLNAEGGGRLSDALDALDYKILVELQANGRIAFAELGRRIGLSTPAVYIAVVNPAMVGLPLRAFIKITVQGDRLPHFNRVAQRVPEVRECHRVTGTESYILQVAVCDLPHLEAVIDSLSPYVATNTSLVLTSPVPWNPVVPAPLLKR